MKIINGRIYEPVESSVFKYDAPTEAIVVEAKNPSAEWIGAKLPYDLWKQIVGFCFLSYQKTKAEAMVRLYYNEEIAQWKAHAFPQQYSGLAVKDEIDDKQYLEFVGDGFILAGTVHHHCAISAFQSGTDHGDEETKAGVHITIGDLEKDTLSFHCRISIAKVMYASDLADFVDLDLSVIEDLDGVSTKFKEDYVKLLLSQGSQPPTIWLSNLRKIDPIQPVVVAPDKKAKESNALFERDDAASEIYTGDGFAFSSVEELTEAYLEVSGRMEELSKTLEDECLDPETRISHTLRLLYY